MSDQFAPYEPEYIKRWRERLEAEQLADAIKKVKKSKPVKVKRKKVRVYVAGHKCYRSGERKGKAKK